MEDKELEFQTHAQRLSVYSYDELRWFDEASKQHSLYMNDALFKFFTDLTIIASNLQNKEASYFMLYGAVRRLQEI
jgi:hypothetical protein